MRIRFVELLFIVIFFASCKKNNNEPAQANVPPCTTGFVQHGAIISGRYIVTLKTTGQSRVLSDNNWLRAKEKLLSKHHIRASALQQSFHGSLTGFIVALTNEEVKKLQADATIDKIEPDRIIALGDCFKIVKPDLITWNVKRTGYGDGTGKTAWIIDSGIEFSHPDLIVDSIRSRSFVNGQHSAIDENGHGTHVAGIIGAKNNDIGLLGVASGAKLVALRVLDKHGIGTIGNIVRALAYVNEQAKPGDVVNISSGADSISNILDDAVRKTAAKGIYVVIAAGNNRQPAINYSPARVNAANVYTVSAVDSLDHFAGFSNYGNDAVDFAAPGVTIISTWTGGQYATMSGTSMAAPHLSGLLLLNGKNIKTSGYAENDPDGNADPIAHH